jgi:hypothetical protein
MIEGNGHEPLPARPGEQTYFMQPGTSEPFPFFEGPGGEDVPCEKCEFVLCAGMEPGMLQAITFECPACRTLTRVTLPGGPEKPVRILQARARLNSVTNDTEALLADLEQIEDEGGQIICPFGTAVVTRTLRLATKTSIRGS